MRYFKDTRAITRIAALLGLLVGGGALTWAVVAFAGSCCIDKYLTSPGAPTITYGPNGPVHVCANSLNYYYAGVIDHDTHLLDCPNSPPNYYPFDDGAAFIKWSKTAGVTIVDGGSYYLWLAPDVTTDRVEAEIRATPSDDSGAPDCPITGGDCPQSGTCNDGDGTLESLTVFVCKCDCEGLEAEVTAGDFDPNPVCAGDETTLTPSAGIPDEACECDSGPDPHYSWSFQARNGNTGQWVPITPNSIAGGPVNDPDDTENPTVKFTFGACGNWEVKALATVSWLQDDCSTRCSVDGESVATVAVVSLDKIVLDGTDDEAPTACNCGPFTMRAIPCPEGAEFPDDPDWYLVDAPQEYVDQHLGGNAPPLPNGNYLGSGTTWEFDPKKIQGIYEFKAVACSGEDEISVNVVEAAIEIHSQSDHTGVFSNITDTTVDWVVGIQAILKVVPVSPAGATLSDYKWSVEGKKIKDYIFEPENVNITPPIVCEGRVVELQAGDLDDAQIDFYWFRGGASTTQVLAKVNGAIWCSASAEFDIADATVTISTKKSSPPGLLYNDSRISLGGQLIMPSGDGAGVYFAAQIGATPPGEVYWIQTLDTIRRKKRNDGVWFRVQADSALDNDLPYSQSSKIVTGDMWDSPGDSPGADYLKFEVSDSFRSYPMFWPNSTHNRSIPVPYKRLDWGWSANATNTGSNIWVFDQAPTHSAPDEKDTEEFPTWTDNIRYHPTYTPEP